MATTDRDRFARIHLSPRAGKILGSYALIGMHGWFLTKLILPSEDGVAELLVGIEAITGMLASVFFFVGTYSVIANAPEAMLDERELADRNRAYFGAFKYIVLMAMAGGMFPEFLAKVFGFELSVAMMENFMLLMFTTALILPGFLLAWSDRQMAD